MFFTPHTLDKNTVYFAFMFINMSHRDLYAFKMAAMVLVAMVTRDVFPKSPGILTCSIRSRAAPMWPFIYG